jgi:hypothetical protein
MTPAGRVPRLGWRVAIRSVFVGRQIVPTDHLSQVGAHTADGTREL